MKAQINEKGLLILISETNEEVETIHKWLKNSNVRFVVPEKRDELAVCRFTNLDIAICHEHPMEPDLLIGLSDETKDKLKSRIPDLKKSKR